MSKFNAGDKVRYIGKDHIDYPEYYPTIGTIGKIIGAIDDDPDCYIQWPKNSTSGNDEHWCSTDDIELVKNEDITNEEIWGMLEHKMQKNGLTSNIYSCTKVDDNGFPCFFLEEAYKNNDVHNAIAIAYRSGYERAMKGRPFKIGEKKKKGGHWKPIDPRNLPKEGTKVRYSRECKEYKAYKNTLVTLGDLGKVDIAPEGWFGIRLDNPRSSYSWLSFHNDGIASCLDMWVEDDE